MEKCELVIGIMEIGVLESNNKLSSSVTSTLSSGFTSQAITMGT